MASVVMGKLALLSCPYVKVPSVGILRFFFITTSANIIARQIGILFGFSILS